jgi:phage-related minor tail protein
MENEKELSAEEIAERKEKLMSYYTDQIKFLTSQLEYETLLTDIEEQRAKRIQMQAAIASFLSPQEEEEGDEKPRTLKRG